jgi:hypothetical protein
MIKKQVGDETDGVSSAHLYLQVSKGEGEAAQQSVTGVLLGQGEDSQPSMTSSFE